MANRVISGHRRFELSGDLSVPGDKSIAHRALILGSLARGRTFIKGVPRNQDIEATIRVLQSLGVSLERSGSSASVEGLSKGRYRVPEGPVDCGGSATTMRLMLGALTGKGSPTVLTGDASLQRRPMRRVMEPLIRMGAQFEAVEGNLAPVTIVPPKVVHACQHEMTVASAQVKTAILLASLFANGRTVIKGAIGSRDHTERLIPRMGGKVVVTAESIIVEPSPLDAIAITVPGDTSTAAFFAAGAALGRNSSIKLNNICVNPTRMGFFEALSWMGVQVDVQESPDSGYEPFGDVTVRWAPSKGIEIHKEAIPYLIDEVPLVILLATQAEGETVLHGISELRHKETDRIRCAVTGLTQMGAEIQVEEDHLIVRGPTPLKAATLDPLGDHRMSMMFTLAAYHAAGVSTIRDVQCEDKSCPEFFDLLQKVLKR